MTQSGMIPRSEGDPCDPHQALARGSDRLSHGLGIASPTCPSIGRYVWTRRGVSISDHLTGARSMPAYSRLFFHLIYPAADVIQSGEHGLGAAKVGNERSCRDTRTRNRRYKETTCKGLHPIHNPHSPTHFF